MTGRWFSLGPPVSSTNKTNCHDITDILLKVALNTPTTPPCFPYLYSLLLRNISYSANEFVILFYLLKMKIVRAYFGTTKIIELKISIESICKQNKTKINPSFWFYYIYHCLLVFCENQWQFFCYMKASGVMKKMLS